MSPIEKYLQNANRGEFKWQGVETTDGYGMGGVKVESVSLKGREATISKESSNEFEVNIILKYPTYYEKENTYEVIDYRASRRSARNLAERLIKKDIEKEKA
ncbi:TPA: hypothetical protein LA460_000320 [Clostridium botulinum]|nr:hypothetical protein [Clostridium botulinum]HBJ1652924.1 hypothetical protein [Clostridium botulinum]